jgi:hypothetical protein
MHENYRGRSSYVNFPDQMEGRLLYVFEESYWKNSIYVLFPTQLTAECCMVYRKITAEDVVMSSYPVTRNNSHVSGLRNVTSAYQHRQKPSFTLIRLDP